MIRFKGRLGFKQYMKDKPTKWGIKVFPLSDAINGYVYRFQIYTGENLNDSVDVGLCSRVCLELMSGLEPGFKLFTDNYYTSPQLYLGLYKLGFNCCGTVRTNRKDFPKDLIVLFMHLTIIFTYYFVKYAYLFMHSNNEKHLLLHGLLKLMMIMSKSCNNYQKMSNQ